MLIRILVDEGVEMIAFINIAQVLLCTIMTFQFQVTIEMSGRCLCELLYKNMRKGCWIEPRGALFNSNFQWYNNFQWYQPLGSSQAGCEGNSLFLMFHYLHKPLHG